MSWEAWLAPLLHGKETLYVLTVKNTQNWKHLIVIANGNNFNVSFFSSTIVLEDHLIHVGYTQFDKELLLLAFPADRYVCVCTVKQQQLILLCSLL